MSDADDELGRVSSATLLYLYRKLEPSVRVIAESQRTILAEEASRIVRNVSYKIVHTQIAPLKYRVYIEMEEPLKYCNFAFSPKERAFGHFLGETLRVCVAIMPDLRKTVVMEVGGSADITVEKNLVGQEDTVVSKGDLHPSAYVIREFYEIMSLADVMISIGYCPPGTRARTVPIHIDPSLN